MFTPEEAKEVRTLIKSELSMIIGTLSDPMRVHHSPTSRRYAEQRVEILESALTKVKDIR